MTLALGVTDHLLLDPRRRIAVARRAIGFEREHHAFLDLLRIVERVEAGDDRPLVHPIPNPWPNNKPNASISLVKPISLAPSASTTRLVAW